MAVLSIFSFFVGRYPLTLNGLLQGDDMQWRVFLTLRASRGIIGCIGGFVLGIAGFVYQTVFKNPLASPDIIGVSSGASAGAAFGILFFVRNNVCNHICFCRSHMLCDTGSASVIADI